jgi:hypothetical protein
LFVSLSILVLLLVSTLSIVYVPVTHAQAGSVIATVVVGSYAPSDVVYDPANGNIYTTGSSGGVASISAASNTANCQGVGCNLLFTLSLGAEAYDPTNGDLYLSSSGRCDYMGDPTCIPSVIALSTTGGSTTSFNLTISCSSCTDGYQNGLLVRDGYALYEATGLAYNPSNGDVYLVATGFVNELLGYCWTEATPALCSTENESGPYFLFVVSSATNEIVATLELGYEAPSGIAYDSSNGDMYIPVNGAVTTAFLTYEVSNVLAVSSANQVVANVSSVGSAVAGIAYDPANGDMYIASSNAGGSVWVISGLTNSVIATVTTATCDENANYRCTPTAVAFDLADGDLYVTNAGSSIVTVVSGSSNAVVDTVDVNSPTAYINGNCQPGVYCSNGPITMSATTGVVYDPHNRSLYVGSGGQVGCGYGGNGNPQGYCGVGSVSVISTIPLLYAGITSSASIVELGHPNLHAFLNSTVGGGVPSYSYQWYLNGAPASGATGPTWNFVPSALGSFLVHVVVTDSIGDQATSNSLTVTVVGGVSSCNIQPVGGYSPLVVYLGIGMYQWFATTAIGGGLPPYTHQWYLNDIAQLANEGGTGSSFDLRAYQPYPCCMHLGQNTVQERVTDAAGATVECNPVTFDLVNPPTVSISPGSTVMVDVWTHPVTYTLTASGGAPPYQYRWFVDGIPVHGPNANPTWTFSIPSWYPWWGAGVVGEAIDSNGMIASDTSMIYIVPVSVAIGALLAALL